MSIVYFLFILSAVFYAALILYLKFGWNKLRYFKNLETSPNVFLSVIIALKDEEENVTELIDSLKKQDYDNRQVEFILIDDHSTDRTFSLLLEQVKKLNNFYVYQLAKSEKGKKAAIKLGVNKSKHNLILTTDADCTMSSNWISSMLNYYKQNKPKLLSGPVLIETNKSIFSQLQALEFASLVGSGAGAIGINKAIMCNAANLLFEKELYANCMLGKDLPSGDDIFLMLYAKSIDKRSVHFIKSKDAIVKTKPVKTLTDFFNQRARWVSKSKAYRDLDILSVAFLVGLVNLLICYGILFTVYHYAFIVLFLTKLIVDFLMLFYVTGFFKARKILIWVIPLQIIYPFYVVLSAVLGLFGNFKWKSRKFA